MLVAACAFSNCHSSPQADFFLTCGDTDEQRDANYLRAASFVALGSRPGGASPSCCCGRCRPGPAGWTTPAGRSSSTRDEDAWKAAARLGRAVPADARRPSRPRSAGETFFTEQRDAGAAQARLRAGDLPQPQRLQRLPAAPGHRRVPLAGGPAPQLRGRAARVHVAGHARRAPVPPGEEEPVHLNEQRGGIDATGAAPCWRARAPTRPPPARRPSIPATASAFCTLAEVAPHRAAGPRRRGQPAGHGQHRAAGVRGAAGGRRRRGRVRHLPRRRRPAPGRRRHRRRRARRGGGQRPQRPRPLHRAWPGAATSTSAAPSGAPTASKLVFAARAGRRRRPGPVAAGARAAGAAAGS